MGLSCARKRETGMSQINPFSHPASASIGFIAWIRYQTQG
jgi:hypothetical protein